MTEFASDAPTPELAALFPTVIPDVEGYVYQYVKAATAQGLASGVPALSFYADRARSAREGRVIDVVAGWPSYPGVVPAIGVALGTEGEDQQHETTQGGFAGTAYAYSDLTFPADGSGLTFAADGTGIRPLQGAEVIGTADYYSEPLAATIMVLLIHENRDERDRLHDELRRVLFPLRRYLHRQDPQIKKVAIDAEKGEYASGPDVDLEPFVIYNSTFTVHVGYEMLEATNVGGADSVLGAIDVTVQQTDGGA